MSEISVFAYGKIDDCKSRKKVTEPALLDDDMKVHKVATQETQKDGTLQGICRKAGLSSDKHINTYPYDGIVKKRVIREALS